MNHAAGWIIPLAYLLANERIRSYGCDSLQSAASFFTKACVPGALNREFLPYGVSYPHMCDLCHGSSFRFCRRDHSEDYFGELITNSHHKRAFIYNFLSVCYR